MGIQSSTYISHWVHSRGALPACEVGIAPPAPQLRPHRAIQDAPFYRARLGARPVNEHKPPHTLQMIFACGKSTVVSDREIQVSVRGNSAPRSKSGLRARVCGSTCVHMGIGGSACIRGGHARQPVSGKCWPLSYIELRTILSLGITCAMQPPRFLPPENDRAPRAQRSRSNG